MFTGPLELVNTTSIGAQLRFMEKDPQTRLELFGSERQTMSNVRILFALPAQRSLCGDGGGVPQELTAPPVVQSQKLEYTRPIPPPP